MLPRDRFSVPLVVVTFLFLLACGLALLSSLCIDDELFKWLNGDFMSSSSNNNNNTATVIPSSSHDDYSSAKLEFQRHLDKEEDDSNNDEKYYEDQHYASTRSKPICPVGLPLGDINLLVITDIHGWIAGQHARHEPFLNVDMGDLVSFYQQLQWQQNPPWYKSTTFSRPTGCPPHGDWFLLFNGDMMDGTGLSTVPPDHMAPLLQQVPFSALNVGNHELYHNQVVDYMMDYNKGGGFIRHWQGNYLASNVDYVVPTTTNSESTGTTTTTTTTTTDTTVVVPFGNRYTFLHGPVLNSTILTFGFLYNFQNNCNHTRVRLVEDTLQEEWFVNVLTKPLPKPYQAIIVMGHMDAVDPLVYKILDAIRALVGPTMPVQFITGHSHRRHFEQLDPMATSLEAGRFMDTIGFASFPLKSTTDYILQKPAHKNVNMLAASSLFQHQFLDANYKVLGTDVLGMPDQDFSTLRGRTLSFNLKQTQERLGLLEVVTDCAPQDYLLVNKPLNDTDSLWWLYLEQVIPTTFFPMLEATDAVPIFIQGTGALRYSLFSPRVVVDDIIAVTPFENPIYQVGSYLTANELIQVLDALHVDDLTLPPWLDTGLPNFGVAGPRPNRKHNNNNKKRYDLYTVAFHVAQTYAQVQNVTQNDNNHVEPPFEPRPIYEPLTDTFTGERKQLGTTKIWMDFVSQEWSCPEGIATTTTTTTSRFLGGGQLSMPSMMATLSIVMVVMFLLSLRRVRIHSQSKKYENMTETASESSPLIAQSFVATAAAAAAKDSPKRDYSSVC